MAASAFVVLAVLLVLVRFHRLNRALRAEVDARRRVQEQLQTSEEQYRLLVDNAPFPVVITELRRAEIRFLNPFAARKLGGRRQQLIGQLATDFYARARDRGRFRSLIERTGHVQTFETRLCARDGTTFWVDLSASQVTYQKEDCLFVVFSDVTSRKQREADLRILADTDPLTGLWNRRKFDELLTVECARTGRSGRASSLISLDIDRFKDINDVHGHPVGDEVLEQLADRLRSSLRATDMVARTGGEEFAVLLPETDASAARVVAEKLRASVEKATFETAAGVLQGTISVGVAAVSPGGERAHALQAADTALYRAKQAGRNRVAPAAEEAVSE